MLSRFLSDILRTFNYTFLFIFLIGFVMGLLVHKSYTDSQRIDRLEQERTSETVDPAVRPPQGSTASLPY